MQAVRLCSCFPVISITVTVPAVPVNARPYIRAGKRLVQAGAGSACVSCFSREGRGKRPSSVISVSVCPRPILVVSRSLCRLQRPPMKYLACGDPAFDSEPSWSLNHSRSQIAGWPIISILQYSVFSMARLRLDWTVNFRL